MHECASTMDHHSGKLDQQDDGEEGQESQTKRIKPGAWTSHIRSLVQGSASASVAKETGIPLNTNQGQYGQEMTVRKY